MEDYVLVRSSNPMSLEQDVKDLLRQGWYCVGGIAMSVGPSGHTWYAQAMMKRGEGNGVY